MPPKGGFLLLVSKPRKIPSILRFKPSWISNGQMLMLTIRTRLTTKIARLRRAYALCLTNGRNCDTLRCEGGDILGAVFGVRLPDDLKQYVQEQAQEHRTSMGHYIVTLILQDMARRKDELNNGNRKAETVSDQAV